MRREARIEFLGEQDGPPERQLKTLLIEGLRQHSTVRRAYLARLGFAPVTTPSVALCLASTAGEDRRLVEICSGIFSSLFNSETALDIVFVSPEQEADLARVCSPFYPPAV